MARFMAGLAGLGSGHPFVSIESACQLVSAEVCLWPGGRHLQVSSWPQVIWVGKWFSYIYEWSVLKVPTLN